MNTTLTPKQFHIKTQKTRLSIHKPMQLSQKKRKRKQNTQNKHLQLSKSSAYISKQYTLPHSKTFEDTIQHVKDVISKEGFHVFGQFDHHRVAPQGSSLAPTTNIYFGKPEQGTPLMMKDPALAVRLPFCMSVHLEPTSNMVTLTCMNPFLGLKKYSQPAYNTQQLLHALLNTICSIKIE